MVADLFAGPVLLEALRSVVPEGEELQDLASPRSPVRLWRLVNLDAAMATSVSFATRPPGGFCRP